MGKILRVKKLDNLKVSFFTFLFFSFSIMFFPIQSFSQRDNEFNAPWKNSSTPIIIDAYHNNSIDWDELKKDKRLVGIIHKATEGTSVSDRNYDLRRTIAKKSGYKSGSYHLLQKGNTIEQAKYYLNKIGKNNPDEIMALDVECTENSKCNVPNYKVSGDEIKTFLKYVKEQTGRYPIFYANQSVVKDLSENYPNDKLLSEIPLWYARFKSNVTDFPSGNCEPNKECLYRIPGTLSDMDINVYNGTIEDLKNNWANIGRTK